MSISKRAIAITFGSTLFYALNSYLSIHFSKLKAGDVLSDFCQNNLTDAICNRFSNPSLGNVSMVQTAAIYGANDFEVMSFFPALIGLSGLVFSIMVCCIDKHSPRRPWDRLKTYYQRDQVEACSKSKITAAFSSIAVMVLLYFSFVAFITTYTCSDEALKDIKDRLCPSELDDEDRNLRRDCKDTFSRPNRDEVEQLEALFDDLSNIAIQIIGASSVIASNILIPLLTFMGITHVFLKPHLNTSLPSCPEIFCFKKEEDTGSINLSEKDPLTAGPRQSYQSAA